MTPQELDECFQFSENLIKKCGEILLEGFEDCGKVESKRADYDLVTVFDRKIESVLINGIKEKYPDHKFIAEEEQASSNQASFLTPAPTWIIDPIDGTINFVKKLHFVCISVAFVIDSDLKFSFLFNPTLNEFYTARKGQGAFLNGNRIFASKLKSLKGSLIAQAPGSAVIPAFSHQFIERASEFLKRTIGIRILGSAALTLGYIAKGAIDVYNIEHLKPWDIAAGVLIIREAGGVVIDKNGGEYSIMKPDIIAAGTIELALEIKDLIEKIDRKLENEGKHPRQLFKEFQEY